VIDRDEVREGEKLSRTEDWLRPVWPVRCRARLVSEVVFPERESKVCRRRPLLAIALSSRRTGLTSALGSPSRSDLVMDRVGVTNGLFPPRDPLPKSSRRIRFRALGGPSEFH
jgi:hypothetical protein